MRETVGFDLDGIFIDRPPLVPKSLIEWFYKDHKKNKLAYRIPSSFEQKIRMLTHLPFVRPPISKNCNLIKRLAKEGDYDFYLISGRFGFLENLTYGWLRKHKMLNVFSKIYLNTNNEQPHQFKEKMLKKIPLEKYIDDDLDSLEYLAARLPKINFYWYTETGNKKSTTLRSGFFVPPCAPTVPSGSIDSVSSASSRLRFSRSWNKNLIINKVATINNLDIVFK